MWLAGAGHELNNLEAPKPGWESSRGTASWLRGLGKSRNPLSFSSLGHRWGAEPPAPHGHSDETPRVKGPQSRHTGASSMWAAWPSLQQ